MGNRVYYGEYTLKHWLDLILKKNIVLPEYQRYFVWDENRVKTLIETFNRNQFVPPITIGAYTKGNTVQNLIIDGQQRLTSLLLACLNIFPDKAKYAKLVENYFLRYAILILIDKIVIALYKKYLSVMELF